MKFFVISSVVLAVAVSGLPIDHRKRDVDASLVPQFGLAAGLNPTGTGDCDGIPGANGQPIKVPCSCPPDRDAFIQKLNANVAAGHVLTNPTVLLSFPEDNSTQSQLARINAAAVTLQNLNGAGVGCPIAATTFGAQSKAISAGQSASPAPAAASPPAASTPAAAAATSPSAVAAPAASTSGTPSADEITQLAPSLGFSAGLNPTGTGDCDGAVKGADGKPVKVPCTCPPDQATYINALIADVEAGHAVNNPTVAVTFPTDNSTQSQSARITAALIALQNLNGAGKGCPAASTTLLAQQKALASGQSAAPPVSAQSPPAAAPAASPAAASPAPAAAPSAPAAAGSANEAQIAQLAPDLGATAGLNPTGTGDCDGAVNGADGKPVKVPCSCPPDQTTYINALTADVIAGHAVNNPTVNVSFPTDDSTQSQITRITAALIALQNLDGPGKGCPAAATTLLTQQKALQAKL